MNSTTTAVAGSVKFPFLLVARWLLSIVLLGLGFWRIFQLAMSWSYFTERIPIDFAYNPLPWLVLDLCVVAIGALLAIRSKWVLVPLFLHVGLFARQIYVGRGGAGVPSGAYEIWAAELLVFVFCMWLLLRGRLK